MVSYKHDNLKSVIVYTFEGTGRASKSEFYVAIA